MTAKKSLEILVSQPYTLHTMAKINKIRGMSQSGSFAIRTLGNQLGVSIVEVLIALGLAAMLGWVLADQQATQIKNNAFNQAVMTAMDLKNRLGMILRDDQAWSNVVVQNSTGGLFPAGGMDCLGNNSTCSARIASPLAFKIYSPSATATPFQSYTTGASNQPGFTISGENCSTFNDSTAGDATCVFGYQITWEVDSPCPGTCLNPPIRITARLKHRPLPGVVVLNTDKYSYAGTNAFIRAGKATALRWTLEHQQSSGSGVPGTGGGVCSTALPYGSPRPLTTKSDPFSLISGSGTTTITVNAKGTFSCTFTSQSFASNNFTASFLVNGVMQNQATGNAAPWNSAAATGTVNFTVPTPPFTLQLYQICQTLPGGAPSADSYTLGMPVPAGGPYGTTQVYATINCASVIN